MRLYTSCKPHKNVAQKDLDSRCKNILKFSALPRLKLRVQGVVTLFVFCVFDFLLPDVEFSQRWSKALCQSFQSEFRCAVYFTERVAVHSNDAADVDDTALLSRFHAWKNRLEYSHDAEEVGVKQVLGRLDWNAFKHTHQSLSSIIY